MVIVHLSDNQRRVISAQSNETVDQLCLRFCREFNYSSVQYQFFSLSSQEPLPGGLIVSQIKEVRLVPKTQATAPSEHAKSSAGSLKNSQTLAVPPPRPKPRKRATKQKIVIRRSAPPPPTHSSELSISNSSLDDGDNDTDPHRLDSVPLSIVTPSIHCGAEQLPLPSLLDPLGQGHSDHHEDMSSDDNSVTHDESYCSSVDIRDQREELWPVIQLEGGDTKEYRPIPDRIEEKVTSSCSEAGENVCSMDVDDEHNLDDGQDSDFGGSSITDVEDGRRSTIVEGRKDPLEMDIADDTKCVIVKDGTTESSLNDDVELEEKEVEYEGVLSKKEEEYEGVLSKKEVEYEGVLSKKEEECGGVLSKKEEECEGVLCKKEEECRGVPQKKDEKCGTVLAINKENDGEVSKENEVIVELRTSHKRETCVSQNLCSIIDLASCVMVNEGKDVPVKDHGATDNIDGPVIERSPGRPSDNVRRCSGTIVTPRMAVVHTAEDEYNVAARPDYKKARAKSLFFYAE